MSVQLYSKIVQDAIEREKAGTDFLCSSTDKAIMHALFEKIYATTGYRLRYLAELDAYSVPGAGKIVAEYIRDFSSESVKGYLVPHLSTENNLENAELILDLYMHFRESEFYISNPGTPSSAHIYTRYDNALKALKPKRLQEKLIQLVVYPRDFFYLPFTMLMLASWKPQEIIGTLMGYSSQNNISALDIGLSGDIESFLPPYSFIKREIRFTAIKGLAYYPSSEVLNIVQQYCSEADLDIRTAAKKTLRKLQKSYPNTIL